MSARARPMPPGAPPAPPLSLPLPPPLPPPLPLPLPQTAASAGGGPPAAGVPRGAQADLSDAVRKYVHYDNLALTLARQADNARTMRADFEARILGLLERHGLRGATLRIAGGASLRVGTRRSAAPLTWGLLEEQLPAYFRARGEPDAAAAVLQFLRDHRPVTAVECLRKGTGGGGGGGAGGGGAGAGGGGGTKPPSPV